MRVSRALLFLFVGLSVFACTYNEQRSSPPQLMHSGSPALHAIDSSELRELMGRMNRLMFERNLTEHEMDHQRRQAIAQVIESADGVEQAIAGILDAMPKLDLDAGEQKVFRSLALKLREEAKTLKSQALHHQDEDIPATLERMSATCNACHPLFRDFGKARVEQ